MNRDALLATLIGFGVGLLIMGGILFGPNLIKNIPAITIPKLTITLPKRSVQPTPTIPASSDAPFRITGPLPDSLQSESDLLVSGSAIGASFVVIQGPGSEAVGIPDAAGLYAETVALVEGRNDITVTMYDDNSAQVATVTVYYSSEDIE